MFEQIHSLVYRFSGGSIYLPGLWERVGDRFEGCSVLVELTPGGLQGRITYVPVAMRRCGWKVGDVKWKDFTRGRLAAYQVQELVKEFDQRSGEIRNCRFTQARIGFLGADEMVVIPRAGEAIPSTRWRRCGITRSDESDQMLD